MKGLTFMDSQILNANIVISGVEETPTQIKIKDQYKKTYSFFKAKKDGQPTKAFEQFAQYKVGEETGIGYKEVPYKDGTIKNLMNFGPIRNGVESTKPAPKPDSRPTEPNPQRYGEARNWDKEAYEKCCSIWAAAWMHNDGAG